MAVANGHLIDTTKAGKGLLGFKSKKEQSHQTRDGRVTRRSEERLMVVTVDWQQLTGR